LFGTLATALSTTAAIAGAISKLGTSATLGEVLLTIPLGGSVVAAAAGVSELVTAVGALAAAFYLGACIGSLIAAAIDTYGVSIIGTLGSWMKKMGRYLKMPAGDYLFLCLMRYPELSPVRGIMDRARQMDSGGRTAYA
jgi:hypothetical protein